MTLFWKIYLASLAKLIVAVALLTAAISYHEANYSMSQLREEHRLLANMAASQVEAGYHEKTWPFELLETISKEPSFTSWQVVDGGGHIVLSDPPPTIEDGPNNLRQAHAFDAIIAPQLTPAPVDGSEMWVVPLRMHTGTTPWTFRLAYHSRSVHEHIVSLITTNVHYALAIPILMFPLSLLITRGLLRPLKLLTGAIHEMQKGNLSVKLPAAGRDEVGCVVTAFSKMTATLRLSYSELEQSNALLKLEIEEHSKAEAELTRHRIHLENLVAQRTVDLTTANEDLVKDIVRRKAAEARAEELTKQLVETSRRVGQADIATGVLHNVGNVLNTVNVSADRVSERLSHSRVKNVAKVADLLLQHHDDLGKFLTIDDRGQKMPRYLADLSELLAQEHNVIVEEITSLRKNIEHIKEIVSMQQSYATVAGLSQEVRLCELVEDALQMNSAALERHQVKLQRNFIELPKMLLDKHKVLQILINLISNAKHAMSACEPSDRKLEIRIQRAPDRADRVQVLVKDNGMGIPPENLVKIFQHGFTTRSGGHGFGLHSGATTAQSLGGQLTAASDGNGTGACFTLELPLKCPAGVAASSNRSSPGAAASAGTS